MQTADLGGGRGRVTASATGARQPFGLRLVRCATGGGHRRCCRCSPPLRFPPVMLPIEATIRWPAGSTVSVSAKTIPPLPGHRLARLWGWPGGQSGPARRSRLRRTRSNAAFQCAPPLDHLQLGVGSRRESPQENDASRAASGASSNIDLWAVASAGQHRLEWRWTYENKSCTSIAIDEAGLLP